MVDAGPDQTVCYGYSIPLAGTPFSTGTAARWRQIGGPAVVIADSTASATSLSGTTAGTVYEFSYTLTNVCGSNTDTVVVTTTTSPGPSDAVINTLDTCISAGAVTLNAAPVSSGSGVWSQLSGPVAMIASPSGTTTSVTGLTGGLYRFLWSVTSPGCDTLRDTVSVAVSASPLTADAGTDRYVCKDSIQMNGTVPATGAGTWTQLAGAPATIADPHAAHTSITGLLPGEYDFRWRVALGVCNADSDDIHVVVSAAPSAAKAMNDTVICGLVLPEDGIELPIQADTPASGLGVWIEDNPFSSSIADNSAANTTIILYRGGFYTFQWRISNGACPSSYDTVSIDLVQKADAGPESFVLCEKESVNLKGTEAGTGTVLWSQLSGPAMATITNPANEITTIADLVPGTYMFRYDVTHPAAGCSGFDTVMVINSERVVANAGSDSVFCWMPGGTSLYLAADTPAAGSGQWSRITGSGSLTFSPNAESNPVNALVADAGLHQFVWTVTNGGCQTEDYKDVLAEQISVPPIDFTPLTACGDTFKVSVTSPYSNFDYAWSFPKARITDTAGLNLTGPIDNNFLVNDTNAIYLTLTNPATGCFSEDSAAIVVDCASLALPLTLLSFRAYKKGAWVLLQWDVAAEKNIRNYVIEHSGDGSNWKPIGAISARNISIRSQYDFTDPQPIQGLNLYRLKINEYDQSSSYSVVRAVIMDDSGPQLLVYPNPAAAEIRVLWNSRSDAAYLLTDGTGRIILEGRLAAGMDNMIDISSVATGFYVLKILSGNTEISTHKVQVRR